MQLKLEASVRSKAYKHLANSCLALTGVEDPTLAAETKALNFYNMSEPLRTSHFPSQSVGLLAIELLDAACGRDS